MKFSISVLGVAAAVALLGCGGSEGADGTTASSADDQRLAANAALEAEIGHPVPKVPPQEGKLTELVVRDVKVGKGPAAQWGDEVDVRYVARVYQTGKIYARHWEGVGTFLFNLDGKSFGVGWQRGIEGMRVGGRREILVPKHLLFEDNDVAYMVTLLWLEQRGG
ncbi:MAG TPA: FKBP-type peptidyl-prolyl cis-trans isomerase [Solirubrobacterales bacterium]|nr:FKBP-type peptidyl-prolyl cis-trans isomerase [Solirubrobacterales bacterium]